MIFLFQRNSVKALLSCEDNEGCTPLHYACRLGIHDSVRNMLGLSGQLGLACKSKDKKSALHFAAQWVTSVALRAQGKKKKSAAVRFRVMLHSLLLAAAARFPLETKGSEKPLPYKGYKI